MNTGNHRRVPLTSQGPCPLPLLVLATHPSRPELVALIREFATVPGGLLPAMHAVQHAASYISPELIPDFADAFNRTVSEVHGVLTFYKDFRTTPPAGPIVQICRAEACQARGGREVWKRAEHFANGKAVHLEEVFCLGMCATGPAIAVDGVPIAPVKAKHIETIIADAIEKRIDTHHTDTQGSGITVYVPRDAAARAAGADEVAARFAEHDGVRVVRNGSWGMLWLEPMIEVETPDGRVAYGPVRPKDVKSLLKAGVLKGAAHDLRLGYTEDLPWIKRQQRVTFQRVGLVDPRSSDDYERHRGMSGLRRALSMTPAEVVADVTDSGLRGRGGAAFPTGTKWKTVLDAPGTTKYIVCNADEGDSGTFADRMLMEGDPFMLIEGMIIAGWAVGAHEGYIYVRSEYPDAIDALNAAVRGARERGWLGANVCGSAFAFDIHVRVGAGAYICGEETALLESLEGNRGVVRAKPPLPALVGLFGKPTVVNNVLTLGTVAAVLQDGATAYADLGVGRSRGTQVFQLAGNLQHGGIVETAFGVTLRELVEELGGGTHSGRAVRAVQVGGPLGAYLPPVKFDLPIDYETYAANDALVGHGGVVVFDDTVDMAEQAQFAMEFCAAESCGKCTPCRIGSTRGVELIDKIRRGVDRDASIEVLVDLCEVMADGSLCAMGGLTPMPVRSALNLFTEDFTGAAT
jgi:formate dehydrogenase iron-sulfur subunit